MANVEICQKLHYGKSQIRNIEFAIFRNEKSPPLEATK